jgi:hypothetical protein
MKLIRLLPKPLAINLQKISIDRLEARLEYHAGMKLACEQMLEEAYGDLRMLEAK